MCLILRKTVKAQQFHIKFTNIKFHKDPFSYLQSYAREYSDVEMSKEQLVGM
jgi:hypothetical protein